MCGIAGIIGDYNENKFKRMVDILGHRGPDNQDIFKENRCILGHTRLKVIDINDSANQPMVSSCGRYIIVFNGEIYNYNDIKSELDIKHHTESDTEVLLNAYIRWQEKCLDRINGMYAFCVWDREKKELFAARDRFGIKPFFYYQDRERFIFASEIKAILAYGIQREPDYKAVHDFLRWGAIDHDEKTWFNGIKKLLPGHYLRINDQGIKIERYWKLSDMVDEDKSATCDEAAEEFAGLLQDSIRSQMIADRTIGTNLSGGVDSSVVTLLASQIRDDINTYTFGYEEERFDERPFAEKISNIANLPNFTSALTPEIVEKDFLRVLIEEDEPFTSFRQLSHHNLYLEHKEKGSTVILEASGGDEIGAGYTGFLWGWYLDMIDQCGPETAERRFDEETGHLGMDAEQKRKFSLGAAANHDQYGICTSDGTQFINPDVLNEDFTKEHSTSFPDYERPFKSNLRNAQYIEMFHTKLPRGLRYVERASSASGREARVPLLDPGIVAHGFSMPNEVKIKDGQFRKYMKQSVKNILPEEILKINKRSVADPQKVWVKGDLAYLFEDILNSETFKKRGIYNTYEARSEFERFKRGKDLNSLGIFQFLITEMWFRIYIDTDFYENGADNITLTEFNKGFK